MSLQVLQTKWKAILPMNRVLRLSKTIEGIFFIFLEYQDEHDILKRRQMLWNSDGKWILKFAIDMEGKEIPVWEPDLTDQEAIADEKFENFKTHL